MTSTAPRNRSPGRREKDGKRGGEGPWLEGHLALLLFLHGFLSLVGRGDLNRGAGDEKTHSNVQDGVRTKRACWPKSGARSSARRARGVRAHQGPCPACPGRRTVKSDATKARGAATKADQGTIVSKLEAAIQAVDKEHILFWVAATEAQRRPEAVGAAGEGPGGFLALLPLCAIPMWRLTRGDGSCAARFPPGFVLTKRYLL